MVKSCVGPQSGQSSAHRTKVSVPQDPGFPARKGGLSKPDLLSEKPLLGLFFHPSWDFTNHHYNVRERQ
jgi:hypothetical protein